MSLKKPAKKFWGGKMDLKLVKEFGGVNFVYKIPSIDCVTLDLIRGTKWPEKAKGVLFQFDEIKENAYEILWNNVNDNYFCRLYYYAEKADITTCNDHPKTDTIKKYDFKSHQEMEDVYVKTISNYFWKPWGQYIHKFYGEERSKKIIYSQAKNDLSNEHVLSHVKNDEIISFLAYTSVREPVIDRDVNWVLWLWIKNEIYGDERKYIKNEFVEFLKKNWGNQVIVAPTEPFNSRPNIFWQKIGFKLGCIGITIK